MKIRAENPGLSHILEAALKVATNRRAILIRLREALQNDNVAEAIKLAKELCGIDDQGCNRTDSRVH